MAVASVQQQDLCADIAIPVIDLAPYLSGMAGALEATAAQLRAALERIGCFIIIHHDVPQALITRAFAAAKRFHFPPITYEQYLLWWYDANYNAALQNDPS
jgi:isopenicillin N synthase-like dioxygenase